LFFATLDPQGWDAVRSIIYQIRADAPDGTLIKEGLIQSCRSGWDPFNEGISLRKSHGSPFAFGVPKGALLHEKPMPNENVFVLKWSRRALLEREGKLFTAALHKDVRLEGMSYVPRLFRTEWLQFKLNDQDDDIKIVQSKRVLRQKGYEEGDAFCSLGTGYFHNHAMTPPVAEDSSCSTWMACDTFDMAPGDRFTHGRIAPVAFTWNPQTRLYEWTRTGSTTGVDGQVIGESSVSRFGDDWIVAARCYKTCAATVWYRTDDLFSGLGEPVIIEKNRRWQCPRHSYKCADGQLRIFMNNREWSPHFDRRNPLYAIDVDLETFEYTDRKVVSDARVEGLPFEEPRFDMSKLCPNQGNRQFIHFRAIDKFITSNTEFQGTDEARAQIMAAAGIHYAEILYEGDIPDPWNQHGSLARQENSVAEIKA